MAAAPFDTFLETLREPEQVTLSPKRLAGALHMEVGDLAELARVHRNTVTGNPESSKLQGAMRDIVRVLAAAYEVNEDRDAAVYWFLNCPISEFDYRTPSELVREGRVDAVLRYLVTLSVGATG